MKVIKDLALFALPPLRRLYADRARLAAECNELRAKQRAGIAAAADTSDLPVESVGASERLPRSNLAFWQELQRQDYFEIHPCYNGLRAFGDEGRSSIERFVVLDGSQIVVVIGCGYGREVVHMAPHVKAVYGIDVSEKILAKAIQFTSAHGIKNFTPVLAEKFKEDIPDEIDIVFSVVVMQHLTRDLVEDYFRSLARKLSPRGVFIVQFLEEMVDGVDCRDAEMRTYEPSVSWTNRQLFELAKKSGLVFREIRTDQVTETALFHWVYFSRAAAGNIGR